MGFLKIWLERWFNMVIAVSSTAKPNFKQGFQVNGSDYTATELNTALGGGDPGTAGTVTASKSVIVDSNKDIAIFRNLSAVNLDAGASGTVGTVDIFPTTASKGKIQIAAADSAGNTTTTITNASQAAARTYTIPDAGANASFVMTAGAQTVAGAKSFSNTVSAIEGLYSGSNSAGGANAIVSYSTTANKGNIAISTEDNTGDTQTNLKARSQAASRNYYLVDAGADANVSLSKQQTFLTSAGTAYAPAANTEAVVNGGTVTFAANTIAAGDYIDFEAVLFVGAINATDTLTARVRMDGVAGTVVATRVLGATTAANDYVILKGRINVRSIVTTTTTMTSVYETGGLEAGAAATPVKAFVGAFTKDTTASVTLVVTGQFSTNSGTNSATLQAFNVRQYKS